MTGVDVEQVLAGLKGFQRDAVEHITDRLYRSPGASRRFLVADETGLGKSMVARGVIASAIAELQHVDHVDRIDVVYICPSVDLAKQNLRRLNVTGQQEIGIASRLTLLALDSARLAAASGHSGKKVNLVSFTPGTSFEMGWQTGSQEERQLLHVLLNGMDVAGPRPERASALFFQGQVATLKRFQNGIATMRQKLGAGPDPVIHRAFVDAIEAKGLRVKFDALCEQLDGLDVLDAALRPEVNGLISQLRAELARASVASLEPDLVILDEFQRFRHLIDPDSDTVASELARNVFTYPDARVLLLSATPYKPYTAAADDSEDDHYQDFMTTLGFLASQDVVALDRIREGLHNYRQAIVTGSAATAEAAALRDALLPFMSRSERPRLLEGRDLHVRHIASAVPTAEDLRGFAALQRFARVIDAPVSLDYWKSIPYFASFMEGYRPGEQARRSLEAGAETPELVSSINGLRSIDRAAVHGYRQIDFANARLRTFAAETVENEWWKLLWIPPSLPYLTPGGAYAQFTGCDVTKRLIFSAWSGVPTSVASLLSYEAERRMIGGSSLTENTADARRAVSTRLDYVNRDGKPASMSALALFWPHPALAQLGDPLTILDADAQSVSSAIARERVDERLRAGSESSGAAGTDPVWEAFFGWPGGWPAGAARRSDVAAWWLAGRGGTGAEDANSGGALRDHAKRALDQEESRHRHSDLALLALHGPGNIAYRALARLYDETEPKQRETLWQLAARLANGIRTLFNRMDVMFLLDQLYGKAQPYWRSVLQYCADGNLQAVLDEYCFQLKLELAGATVDAAALEHIVDRAVEALTLRTSRYYARTTDGEFSKIPMTVRFALRYGGAAQDSEGARAPEVRNAFNSPFWPFVLASTSVGQEGIDFHWWSHCVTHWNLPSNPVDFEQREGRVNRFAGHAVRKNVAAAHGRDALAQAQSGSHPWQCAFDAAVDHDELGEFAPWWIYPGEARVERLIVHFPLSREHEQYQRLRDSLTLYRMMLGQPRQEDMLELLRQRGVAEQEIAQLNLAPPRRQPSAAYPGLPGKNQDEVSRM
ncbi:DEAD/DEAH box helicase [Mycolicibacter sinensis]